MKDTIKTFYSDLQFPGTYGPAEMRFYQDHGVHNRYLVEIEKLLTPGMKVLDVGCGTGMLTNLFASRFPEVEFTALDFSDSIDYGKQYSEINGNHNTTWIKIDFLSWECLTKFDIVVCCGVLHHMPDWVTALKKLKSLIRPGGSLAMAVYNPWGKILKRFIKIKYHCDTLYHDQENNPFELSFSNRQVRNMCSNLEFRSATPSIFNRFVDVLSWFNSENGGLVLYIFNKRK